MTGKVYKDFPRPAPAVIAGLALAGVATAHEAQGRKGLMASHIRPVFKGCRIAGPAFTVSVPPGDNWMIHVALEWVKPGDILVVAPTSPCIDGYFGDLLAEAAMAKGCVALVIDAGVRDSLELEKMGFPVWARAVYSQGTIKAALGSVNVPLICAGAHVRPGDAIIADDDGVCVVARQYCAQVLDASRKRESNEASKRLRLADGEHSLDVFDLRQDLDRLGISYFDTVKKEDGES